jgi:hypothetical protein
MLFDPSEQDTVIIPIGDVPADHVVELVSILGSLSCLTVSLRVYTRIWILQALEWDDTLMITAQVRH